MADAVGIGEKTEKSDSPKYRPEQHTFMKPGKSQLHLNMPLVEPGTDTGVPVRAAAYDFPLRVTAKVAVCENLFQKGSTVSGRRTNLRVNRSGKTEIKMAGSENQLIKMKNF